MTSRARCKLLTTTCLCIGMIGQGSAGWAQEAPGQEGFLGTLTLGESKRAVQTETATPKTVIDEEEIRDRQAGSVAELLVTVPSVALLNGDTAQGSGISIRGFGANDTFGTDQKVLIQVDGATRGSEELYRIGTQLFTDPFLFKEVEVIRGTVGSFEYGSGVVGGVVRLETIDPEDVTGGEIGFGLRQTLEFQTNGNGVTSSSIGAWQPTENFGILFNYVSRNLGFPEDGNGNVINPQRARIDDPSWLIKAKYRFGQDKAHSIEASFQDTRSSQFDVPFDSFGNLLFFGNVDREVESQTSILRYNFNPLNDLVDLTLQYSHVDESIIQNAVSCPGSPPAPVSICSPLLSADHDYETTTLTLKNTALFDTGALRHDLTAGFEYINRERVNAFAAPGGEDNRWAIFVVDEIAIGRAWTVTPAIRYETSTVKGDTAPNDGRFSEDALMGGLSVRYAFNNGFALFGSAAYTEVLPIIDDLEFPVRIGRSEKSRTYELGFSYDRRGLLRDNDSLALKVTYFDSALWDVNSFVDTTPAQNLLDEIQTEGLEFEASYAMENGFYVDFNATIADGEEVDVLGGVRDWRNLAANNLRATVGKVFDDAYDLSWEVVSADSITVNGVRDDGFTVHNLRGTIAPKRGAWEGTEFRLGIENLFNEQYMPNLATRPAVGRNFKITLAKTF